jgi:hypothetical protein
MMLYAPRALRHFSMAALEGRNHAATPVGQPPPAVRGTRAQPMRRRTVVRLWLPATFIFLLLAPFALMLTPLVCLAPRPYGDRPLATVLGVGRLLLSLGGVVVDVETPDALVRIRIF